MTKEELVALCEGYDEIMLADGLEDAFIGFVTQHSRPTIACYDKKKCVEILMERDGMSEEEAWEYLEFNTFCAYVGEGTPAFLDPVDSVRSGKDVTP